MASCKDCIHFELCEAFERCNGLARVDAELCGFYKPTADAVEAEIARKIFKEIRMLCLHIDNVYDAMRFEALIKKYTEGEQ